MLLCNEQWGVSMVEEHALQTAAHSTKKDYDITPQIQINNFRHLRQKSIPNFYCPIESDERATWWSSGRFTTDKRTQSPSPVCLMPVTHKKGQLF